MRRLTLALTLLFLLCLPAAAQEAEAAKAPAAEPQPASWLTSHTLRVGDVAVEYEAEVGSLLLRDESEAATAELFFTAYRRTDVPDAAARPLVFAYNGGPGSASFWLHMGILGPRRVVTPNVGQQAPPPYPVIDNDFTVLDVADLVMIDPVGTGLSRTIGEVEGETFWGVDEDAAAIAQFIRRFLSRERRWNSPRYLLGESYGTTRSAVLARHLQRANVDLNGIVLVSSVLDFSTVLFPEGAIVPYVVNLPSYAAAAAYLGALPDDRASDLDDFLREVEDWAVGDYAAALFAGSTLLEAERERVIERLHGYTGLDREFLAKADLRVSAPEFEKELLRDEGLIIGRLDARFTGPGGDPLEPRPEHDPQSTAIASAYTSAFNAYLRDELGYDGEREYVPSGNVRPWNWDRGEAELAGLSTTPNVAGDLADALRRNPELRVLLVNGIYDLATPYFAAVWTFDQMGLPPDLRDNIERVDFPAGHMMYVEQSLLPRWKQVLDAFLGDRR